MDCLTIVQIQHSDHLDIWFPMYVLYKLCSWSYRPADFFWQVLPNLKNLEVINFGDCLVKTEGAKALAECLRSALNNLKELNLSFDEINKEGALAIVEALTSKESLEKLELNGKFFSFKLEL